jgi:hypothetical protein
VERVVEEEEAEYDVAGTTSFIQVNLQHSIAASKILSRAVSIKGTDMALIQELWYREGRIRGLNIAGYILFSMGGIERPRACILTRKKTYLDAARILLQGPGNSSPNYVQ